MTVAMPSTDMGKVIGCPPSRRRISGTSAFEGSVPPVENDPGDDVDCKIASIAPRAFSGDELVGDREQLRELAEELAAAMRLLGLG